MDKKKKTYGELSSETRKLERMAYELDRWIHNATFSLDGRNAKKALKELKKAREEFAAFFQDDGPLDHLIADVEEKTKTSTNKVVQLPARKTA